MILIFKNIKAPYTIAEFTSSKLMILPFNGNAINIKAMFLTIYWVKHIDFFAGIMLFVIKYIDAK